MLLSILTPCYKRAMWLPSIAESLLDQTAHDIEWLIVNDGSPDNTDDIAAELQSKYAGRINISVVNKPNGGKHTAVNVGAMHARGKYILILDSDDRIAPGGIQALREELERVEQRPDIGAVLLLRVTEEGESLGKRSAEPLEGFYRELSFRDGKLEGDYAWCFRAEALREYPFPVFEGERFLSEAVMLARMSGPWKILVVDRPLEVGTYEPGGLTDRFHELAVSSPLGMMLGDRERFHYSDIPFKIRIHSGLRYWKYHSIAPKPLPECVRPTAFLQVLRPFSAVAFKIKKLVK